MQESIFDLFGSHNAVVKQHLNSRQTTSVSSFHSLAATSNLKQKSGSVGGSTSLKRALGDLGNQLQHPRSGLNKEEGRKPLAFSCEQKSPTLNVSSKKSPTQKLCNKNQSGLKITTPVSKKVVTSQPTLQDISKCLPEVDWGCKPEIFPDPDITEFEDDYEDFFPLKGRLTEEDIYRVVTNFGKAEGPQEILIPPDLISPLPFPDIAQEIVQCLDLSGPLDDIEEQVSLPDLLWDIIDTKYEDPLRHTL